MSMKYLSKFAYACGIVVVCENLKSMFKPQEESNVEMYQKTAIWVQQHLEVYQQYTEIKINEDSVMSESDSLYHSYDI